MKTKTIYIAGKISVLPYWYAYFQFFLREMYLTLLGYDPVNPMRSIPKDWCYERQVMLGCELAIFCEYIYLSHNWRESKGAKKEYKTYCEYGKNKVVTFW